MGKSVVMNQEALTVHHQHVGTVPITDPLLDGMSDAVPDVLIGTLGIKMGPEGGERKGALSVEDYTLGGAWLAAECVIDVVKRGTSL